LGDHVVVVDILNVPTTTPAPDGMACAVELLKMLLDDEKFNFLVVEVYGKLVVPVFGQFNHPGSVLSFNALQLIVPVVKLGACTPRIIKALKVTAEDPTFVKRIWKSAVLVVELNHSISILSNVF
jgi:hypothetical protein